MLTTLLTPTEFLGLTPAEMLATIGHVVTFTWLILADR